MTARVLDSSSCAPPPLPAVSPVARCRLSTLRCIAQLHSIKLITQYGGGTDIICFLSALLATGRWLELSAAWLGQFLIMVQVCWRRKNSHPALLMSVSHSVEKTRLVAWEIFNIPREKSLFEDLSFFSNLYFYRFYKFVFGYLLYQTLIWGIFSPFFLHLHLSCHSHNKKSTHGKVNIPSIHPSSTASALTGSFPAATMRKVVYRSSHQLITGLVVLFVQNKRTVIPVCVTASEKGREREREGERGREWGGGSWNLKAPDNNVLLHLYWFSWHN